MKRIGRVLRGGFVLPMALMATFVVLLIVSAGAYYCTNYLRTSDYYLARTRCRLAAQSAIEAAKLRLQSEITASGHGNNLPDPTNSRYHEQMADIAAPVNAAFVSTNICGCTVNVRIGTASAEGDNQIFPFYATARSAKGALSVSVTLQESVRYHVSNANVFNYAYFANTAGRLVDDQTGGSYNSTHIIVNGDVRANGSFKLEGAVINGSVIATNTISLKNCWSQTFSGYNNTWKNSQEGWFSGNPFYYPAFSQVRPTNPLSVNGVEWAGGYDPIAGNGTNPQRLQNDSVTLTGVPIVHPKEPSLMMPKIEGFAANQERSGLEDYVDYARLVRTPGRKIGGSLSCRNRIRADSDYQIPLLLKDVARRYMGSTDVKVTTYSYSSGYKLLWSKVSSGYINASNRYVTDTVYSTFPDEEKKKWSRVTKGYRSQSSDYYTYSIIEEKTDKINITRELRHIEVYNGNQINLGALTGTSNDKKDKEASNDVALGSTTASLRPFRDDDSLSLNRLSSADKGAVILIGTWDDPITIDGPVVFYSDVVLRGFVSGRGTIYSGRNIHIIGDINYKHPPYWPHDGTQPTPDGVNTNMDMLALISRGSIVIGNPITLDERIHDDYKANNRDWETVRQYISGAIRDESGQRYIADGEDYTLVENFLDVNGSPYRKVKFAKDGSGFWNLSDDSSVKRYESVVGDYIFESEHCLFSALFDRNAEKASLLLGSVSFEDRSNETILQPKFRASFFSDAIENWLAETYKTPAENRAKRNDASFTYWKNIVHENEGTSIFNGSSWWTFWLGSLDKHNYAKNEESWFDGTSNPKINCIRKINAVLYSSRGLFGVLGGKGGDKSYATINGAVIGQDECLIPFARRNFQCIYTINWDMRLGTQTKEALGGTGVPESKGGGSAKPYTCFWQEVPDDFNPAN